jgi:hypothetical protein
MKRVVSSSSSSLSTRPSSASVPVKARTLAVTTTVSNSRPQTTTTPSSRPSSTSSSSSSSLAGFKEVVDQRLVTAARRIQRAFRRRRAKRMGKGLERMVSCFSCGRFFSTASLPIHQRMFISPLCVSSSSLTIPLFCVING